MTSTKIWQVCVRYRSHGIWRTFRTGYAFETKRAALDRATMMQQTNSVIGEPERWFASPLTLLSE